MGNDGSSNHATGAASAVFQPLPLGRLRLAGRLFKSATSETRATADGLVTDSLLEFYQPIAAAGTPLVITGNIYVDRGGKSAPGMCGADTNETIPGLRRWARLAHDHDIAIFAQLNHCGRQVLPHAVGLNYAVSASSVREKFFGTKPRPLRTDQAREIAERFGEAARRCRDAGFDGVQIHAAHGYLISQFLTPYTNLRRDEYGGSFAARLRFLREVYGSVRERTGDDYPVILKLNGDDHLAWRSGLGPAELVEIAHAMQEEGVDGIEVSCGHYESGFHMMRGNFDRFYSALLGEGLGNELPYVRRVGLRWTSSLLAFASNRLWPHVEGYNLPAAAWFKRRLSIPVVCVGGFCSAQSMTQALERGWCDAVSCGRAMIADPALYKHLAEGAAASPCDYCNGCIARAGSKPLACYNQRIAPAQTTPAPRR